MRATSAVGRNRPHRVDVTNLDQRHGHELQNWCPKVISVRTLISTDVHPSCRGVGRRPGVSPTGATKTIGQLLGWPKYYG